jgi:hypothetical protein
MNNIHMRAVLMSALIILPAFAGGWLFYSLWRGLIPQAHSRLFWRSFPQSLQQMLASEETAEMFGHYRKLIAATGRYAGRSLLAVLIASVPVALIFLLVVWLEPANPVGERSFVSYLSATELMFFIAVMAGSVAAAVWSGRRRATR